MISGKMPSLQIGNLVAEVPIIQGGMGVSVSLSSLASAVANEGGVGIISATGIGMIIPGFEKDFRVANVTALKNELYKSRILTKGLIGINLLLAITDFDDLARVAMEEGADMIFIGAGLPLKIPKILTLEKLKKHPIKLVPIVSSVRATRIIFDYWAKEFNIIPDAVVVEGPLAGGHLGFKKSQIDSPDYAIERVIPPILEEVKKFEILFNKHVPVIAAGGIYTGEDIYKFLKMGVHGVQMATRFVTTYECDASEELKLAYIKSKKEDIVIIDSPVGMPGRAIHNHFLEDVAIGIKKPFKCPWKCLKTCDYHEAPYCIALALKNAKEGQIAEGFCFAGANAYRAEKIISVKELMNTIKEEYRIATEM